MSKEKVKLISDYLRYMADAYEKQMNGELDENPFDLRQACDFIISEVQSLEDDID